MDRLLSLYNEFGQSPWLDNLKRGYITSGELAGLVDQGVRGLTSQPDDLPEGDPGLGRLRRAVPRAGGRGSPGDRGLLGDGAAGHQQRARRVRPVYHQSYGVDGYVSVEVDPGLAHDAAGTETAARILHETIDRPNLMVKIPATAEGLPAIQQMIAEGRSINVTLIFSLDRYEQVMEAYIAGLEQYAATPGADLSKVASVASFFISRVDTEIDHRLDAIGSPDALALRGKGAVAQGKLAYQLFQRTFSGPRWEALTARGAVVQRPLWATTSTKNPAYPDTLYVDELIGPDTVNTLPDATLEAFADHGTLAPRVDADVDQAEAAWKGLAAVGVDLDDVADKLEREGVASFQKSFDELLGALAAKADELRAG